MWPVQRLQLGFTVALATGAILILSQRLSGLVFYAAVACSVALALWFGWRMYRRTVSRWVTESYRMMGDALLPEVLKRVDAELARPTSPVAKGLLQIMRSETLLWMGELTAALEQAQAVDVARLHASWHRPVWGTQVAALMFLNRGAEAAALVDAHREVLEEAPGFHQLEAAVAMSNGELDRAQALMTSRDELQNRPRLLLAAQAMLEGELAARRGEAERARNRLSAAVQLGGASMIPARAKAALQSLGS